MSEPRTAVVWWTVPVRNQLNGMLIQVAVRSPHSVDAQKRALTAVFRARGWRKIVADVPTVGKPDDSQCGLVVDEPIFA